LSETSRGTAASGNATLTLESNLDKSRLMSTRPTTDPSASATEVAPRIVFEAANAEAARLTDEVTDDFAVAAIYLTFPRSIPAKSHS
jgi:hypothetical protein